MYFVLIISWYLSVYLNTQLLDTEVMHKQADWSYTSTIMDRSFESTVSPCSSSKPTGYLYTLSPGDVWYDLLTHGKRKRYSYQTLYVLESMHCLFSNCWVLQKQKNNNIPLVCQINYLMYRSLLCILLKLSPNQILASWMINLSFFSIHS